jgi:putative toxin-antitoxin system antitoxin component (TIGR02293 family)
MKHAQAAKRSAATAKRAADTAAGRASRSSAKIVAFKDYAEVFQAPPQDRVSAIKQGVPAAVVTRITKSMGTSKDGFLRMLGLSRATIDRKISRNGALSADEGQRVIGIAKLVGLVETMTKQSGSTANFDAAKWLAQWINQASPALGGKKPAEFLDTAEGQELVSSVLQRMQSGAYS